MSLDLRLQQKLTQQLVMTPQLQQAIKLLQLSHAEMAQALRDEIAQNPVLEDDPSIVDAQERRAESLLPQAPAGADNFEAEGSLHTQASLWERGPRASGHEGPSLEASHTRPTSLVEHLRWQVHMAGLDSQQRAIALFLVEEVQDNGYLSEDAVALCVLEFETSEKEVVDVLGVIQEFDPQGVGARNLRECLLVQAQHLATPNALVTAIIDKHLPAIPKRQFAGIARTLRVSVDEVTQAVRIIAQLEPRPGRAFVDTEPSYIVPDIYVSKTSDKDGELVVSLNEDSLPRLQIAPFYQGARAQSLHGSAKAYVQDKLRAAHWLMRSVAMRQRTIYKVMQSILHFQRDFFEEGPHALRPLILRDVAEHIGMHESTISRVTTNKYVHTPQGIFELKFFFNSTIRGVQGTHVASESVRSHIERIIAQEDKHAPLSDQKIVDLLKGSDISIARRTVAKYRKMLKKDSSCARKRDF